MGAHMVITRRRVRIRICQILILEISNTVCPSPEPFERKSIETAQRCVCSDNQNEYILNLPTQIQAQVEIPRYTLAEGKRDQD